MIFCTLNPDYEQSAEFLRSISSARFLFGDEIYKYLETIYKNSIQLKTLNINYANNNNKFSKKERKKRSDYKIFH